MINLNSHANRSSAIVGGLLLLVNMGPGALPSALNLLIIEVYSLSFTIGGLSVDEKKKIY